MCIIIHKPKGEKLDEDKLRFAWSSNSDGAGWMFARGGKLVIRKGIEALDDAIDGIKKDIKETKNGAMVIHLRYTTRGGTNKENCHPFRVKGRNVGMVHNGTIHKIGVSTTCTGRSDSRIFAEDYLPHFANGFEMHDGVLSMIKEFISLESRVAFMNAKGQVSIVNEEKGDLVDGCWYSNDYYKKKRTQSTNFGSYDAGGYSAGYGGGKTTVNCVSVYSECSNFLGGTTWKWNHERDSFTAVNDTPKKEEVDASKKANSPSQMNVGNSGSKNRLLCRICMTPLYSSPFEKESEMHSSCALATDAAWVQHREEFGKC